MGLYDVPMFMSLFGFGIGMMFASFHIPTPLYPSYFVHCSVVVCLVCCVFYSVILLSTHSHGPC